MRLFIMVQVCLIYYAYLSWYKYALFIMVQVHTQGILYVAIIIRPILLFTIQSNWFITRPIYHTPYLSYDIVLYNAGLLLFLHFFLFLLERWDFRATCTTSPTARVLFPLHFLEPSLNPLGGNFDMNLAGTLYSACGFCMSHMVEGCPLNRSSHKE